MRLPFRRKALTASAEVNAAIQGGWNAIPLLGSGPRQRILDIFNTAQSANYAWRYQHSPAVSTVIATIVRNVGQLDLRAFDEQADGSRKPNRDHPAARSLRNPSETHSGDQFIRQIILDRCIHDNAYAVMNPRGDGRVMLNWIPAYMVEVQGDTLLQARNYRLWPQGVWTGGNWGGSGTPVDIRPENMLHWHGEHPTDPRVGYSKLDTLADVIAEDAALQAASIELANSGFTDSVWAFRPETAPELGKGTRRALEEDLGNRIRRRNRTPVVLEEGTELRSFGVSPRDAQAMEIRRWAIERTAAEYGVSGGMVGLNPISPDERASFLSDCLAPLCEDFVKFMEWRFLLNVMDWEDGRLAFNLDEKFAGDTRMTTLVSASARAVLTTNEARAQLDLPPVKGGDELATPLNVSTGANPKPSPDTMPPQQPGGPDQGGSFRRSEQPFTAGTPARPAARNGASANGAGKAMGEDGEAELEVKASSERRPQYGTRRSIDMERQDQNIALAEGPIRRHFNRLNRELAAQSAERGAKSADLELKAVDWGRLRGRLAADLLRTLRKIVFGEAEHQMLRMGGGEFDRTQVHNYLQAKADGYADGLQQVVRQEVKELGIQAALARAPAHTAAGGGHLGVTSTIFAREEAAKQSPLPDRRVKSWVADTDRHAEFDGQTIPLGAQWPQGFGPGEQKNCRCTAVVT